MEQQVTTGLKGAVEAALSKSTEKERIVAVLDCIRGYKSQYDPETEKAQNDGFMKCKTEYRNQINKVKDFVNSHNL